jgi:hypothetical protein
LGGRAEEEGKVEGRCLGLVCYRHEATLWLVLLFDVIEIPVVRAS